MAGLCLSRAINEAILIGDSTTVTVQEIRNGKVRLKIVAPPDVRVDRVEVATRKKLEQQIAAGVPLHDLEDRADLDENQRRVERMTHF